MRKLFGLILLLGFLAAPARAAEEYKMGPDSERHSGVPKGEVTHYTWTSKIFPGTTRDYWVYVPAQYNPAKPACLMIFQDGEWFMQENNRMRIPIVFDNLISKGEMPVTIGIFINPGVLKALSPDQQDRFNRSFEYDALGDRYARFLLEEILPEVGKHWNLSTNPDDRAIAGLSSGGICAFNAAWNRPDAFHRVLSFIGSFTDLRGGDIYPALIRKTEPKPLRVFLQDGSNDLNLFAGDWWLANQTMASALKWAGYDVKFVTGDKDHDMNQGGAILPDALRWLWRDYPQPILKPAPNGTGERSIPILDPKSEWEAVPIETVFTTPPPPGPARRRFKAARAVMDHGFSWISGAWESRRVAATGLAADSEGNIFFDDLLEGRIARITPDGKVSTVTYGNWPAQESRGLQFGTDRRLYSCQGDHVAAYDLGQQIRGVVTKGSCQDLAVAHDGAIYVTDPTGHGIWMVDRTGHKKKEDLPMFMESRPNGIRLSPDESLLYVTDPSLKWVWSFQIQVDGSLTNPEPFFRLETYDEGSNSNAAGMALDTQGYLYVTTNLGIQVCDQPGRVVAIINPPADGPLLGVTFGGKDFDYLYVDQGDKLYRRHMLRKGIPPGTVLKPPTPRL